MLSKFTFIVSFTSLLTAGCLVRSNAVSRVAAQAVTAVGDIGEHFPLFVIEKSYHPENVIVVYTKLDQDCHIVRDRKNDSFPTLDFYWLMNKTQFKAMAATLKVGVSKRLHFQDSERTESAATSFSVRVDDLAHVQHDMPNPTIDIIAGREADGCRANAFVTLGPSDGSALMHLETIATETEPLTLAKQVRAVANPESIQIYSVTLKGTDVTTGGAVRRTYRAALKNQPK